MLFKKSKNKNLLYSPTNGRLISLGEVNDPLFSSKSLGNGYAVKPSSGEVFSPVAGQVVSIFPTKHAIGIRTKSKDEFLLHVGIDTVELDGEGFEIAVQENDYVDQESLILTVDLDLLSAKGYETDIMVIMTTQVHDIELDVENMTISHGDVVGKIK
ncbi:hypothetical protein BAU15_00765 [Enterococcus sp. JM4C]|uniref:PTS sugar transporter subunit IIA n=1 Tax=Candidatus Enterococcus huntleyi TaxID=1857217 RepID=UPI00137A71EF|nr:PTS glucose transporter subunit IIA [Enterococcus sp. JM4C]KAF1299209.1 hypothetical protein BAU15_00765 [Enterococcus sp. JM4C]